MLVAVDNFWDLYYLFSWFDFVFIDSRNKKIPSLFHCLCAGYSYYQAAKDVTCVGVNEFALALLCLS